ncbi:MAG: hypothetical protein GY765_16810 [bacterium]|nr:hypothetical protein [bacterium]
MKHNLKKYVISLLLVLVAFSLPAKELNFVIMGDNRPSDVLLQPYVFYKLVKRIAEMKPDAVFSTGDIIYGYTDDLQRLKKMYDHFDKAVEILGDIPLYIVPGNHEMINIPEIYKEFTRRYNKPYFSVDIANCHFTMLCSDEPNEESQITGAQWEWLKKDLEKTAPAMHKYVLVHQPLYPKIHHIHYSLDMYPQERDELAQLLNTHGVEMVFCGHTHIYNYTVNNGLHQLITGGAGAPLYAENADNGGFYHYIHLVVNGDDVDYRLIQIKDDMKTAGQLRKKGDFAGASEVLQKARKLLPKHPAPIASSALLHYYLNKEKEFNVELDYLTDYYKSRNRALLEIAKEAVYSDGNINMALILFNRILEKNPDDFLTLYEIASMYYEIDQKDLMAKYFKKVLQIKPNHCPGHYYYAKYYYRKKQFATAKTHFEKAVQFCGQTGYGIYAAKYLKRIREMK